MSTVERITVERVRGLNTLFGDKSYFRKHADRDVVWVTVELYDNLNGPGQLAEVTYGHEYGKRNVLNERSTGMGVTTFALETDLEYMHFRMVIAALMDMPYSPTETYYTTHENCERPT